MKAYTDYPLLNSTPKEILEVGVISYDRNKYAKILHNGELYEVKAGYLYHDRALTKRFKYKFLHRLPKEPNGQVPNKLDVSQYLKHNRKTEYDVWVVDKRYVYSNLDSAMRHFARVYKNVGWASVTRVVVYDWRSFSTMSIISWDNGVLETPIYQNGHSFLKQTHMKKYFD